MGPAGRRFEPCLPDQVLNFCYMAILPEKPTLADFQRYVREMCCERGFDSNTHEQKMLLFIEEVGELAKAMRKHAHLFTDAAKADKFVLEEEFADVFIYLLDIANGFEVDLEKAFREKEALNAKRTWR